MRFISAFLISLFGLIVLVSLKNPSPSSIGYDNIVEYFKTESRVFATSSTQLQSAISSISINDPNTIENARKALKNCRLKYKSIEFFIAYFFKGSSVFFNGPPKFEVEEPFMEWQTPIGLQVIETLLFEENVESRKAELLQQADAVSSSATDLNALLYGFKADDKQILESTRLELIRIFTLGITGFDAPSLKSGITESYAALKGVQFALQPFLELRTSKSDSVAHYLNSSLYFLAADDNFDNFDRLTFLTKHGLLLQKQLGLLIKELHLVQNSTNGILNYESADIFSPDAINITAFPNANVVANNSLLRLGKMLFFETALSGSNKISCATCHNPKKHFADALPRSLAFNGHSHLRRNAPSLLYSGYQFEQFWDGRSKSLEEQVKTVMLSPEEMNGDFQQAITNLHYKKEYEKFFKEAFSTSNDSIITLDKIASSIATFVRTLNPRNSPFDIYMQGNKNALTEQQKQGFNLFMGKAQCATCHFAPLFNGLVPPLYDLSELEVLGTPKTEDFINPVNDPDRGRYDIFPIEFYERAFKTPTVRNVSATGPYMHNGAFRTLEKVVEFYNKGGGKGLGLKIGNQTLSSEPLHLTNTDVSNIVSFMGSLEDSIFY